MCHRVCLSVSVCLSVPNRLLNHATQWDQTLHEDVNKSGKVTLSNRIFFERDWPSNSEKFCNNLEAPPGECYCNVPAIFVG